MKPQLYKEEKSCNVMQCITHYSFSNNIFEVSRQINFTQTSDYRQDSFFVQSQAGQTVSLTPFKQTKNLPTLTKFQSKFV